VQVFKKSIEFSAIFSKKPWKTLRERKNNSMEAGYLKIAVNFQKLKTLSSRPGGELPILMFSPLNAFTAMFA
jgi:hypothetical protein